MEAYHVLGLVAGLTIALVAVRGLQAIAEHYFPNSEPVVVARFIYGGP